MSGAVELGTYIRFEPGQSKPKTLTWNVVSKDGGSIGEVIWYAPWRKYCYCPHENTVYEQVCLREIASFCERKTREHWAKGGAT